MNIRKSSKDILAKKKKRKKKLKSKIQNLYDQENDTVINCNKADRFRSYSKK